MSKKFFTSLFIFMLFCSPALAAPRLWAIHNTMVDIDSGPERSGNILSTDLDTARFFCLTLEAADDEDMPELPEDTPTPSTMTITGGKYSYWNGDGVNTVNDTVKSFDIARSDTVMYFNLGTLIGSDNMGYVPTNEAGDWVHFFGEAGAEPELSGKTVTWSTQDKSGSGTVPTFKTTEEQLAEIVPYIEYIRDDPDSEYKGFNWRFVHSDDVMTAVSAEEDMTISIRFSFGQLSGSSGHDYETLLKDSSNNGLEPRKFKAGETLSGTVNFTELSSPRQTVIRYYAGDNKQEAYQWRFMWKWPNTKGSVEPPKLHATYGIELPIIDNKPEYKYARYAFTELHMITNNLVLEPKYFNIGTITFAEGDYTLVNAANGIELDTKELNFINRAFLGENVEYAPLMKENFRLVGDYNYLDTRYDQRNINVIDATGSGLSGKKITWTFPNTSELNGEAIMPDFKSVEQQLSPDEGFFPYIEFVSEDNKLKAIHYSFVQSPDVPYTPKEFCAMVFELNLKDGSDYYTYGNIYGASTDIKAVYDNDTWTLPALVDFDNIHSLAVRVYMYPSVSDWDEFEEKMFNTGYLALPEYYILYCWTFRNDLPMNKWTLIDEEELDEMTEDIAEAIGNDVNDIRPVQMEEVVGESDVTEDVTEVISDDNAELVGRFNQLNITESGTYVVNVKLSDELFDEIEGASSVDLVVYPVTESDIDEPVVTSMFMAAASDTKPVSGQLLASDGTAFDTINSKELILTTNLKKAAGENYTNYSLYLGLKTSTTPEDPETPTSTTPEEPETPTDKTEEKPETTETPGSTETPTEKEEPEKKPETTDKPEESKPADSEKTPGSTETPTSKAENDEAQKIDAVTTEKIVKIISSDKYEVKTIEEAKDLFTNYNTEVNQNERVLNTISDDFTDAEALPPLPAFTLKVDEPVMLIFKIEVDKINNLPLHFFKEKGAEVAGASLKFVKFASNPETGEDTNAIFSDGTKEITKLTTSPIYVSALFESGSYAPVVITGNAKSDSSTGSTTGSSGSGCNTSLLGLGALAILLASFKRK